MLAHASSTAQITYLHTCLPVLHASDLPTLEPTSFERPSDTTRKTPQRRNVAMECWPSFSQRVRAFARDAVASHCVIPKKREKPDFSKKPGFSSSALPDDFDGAFYSLALPDEFDAAYESVKGNRVLDVGVVACVDRVDENRGGHRVEPGRHLIAGGQADVTVLDGQP